MQHAALQPAMPSPPLVSLPPGWETRADPSTGKRYYHHQATGRGQWAFPTLPPGWNDATDPITGDQYYFNRMTGQTQWAFPTADPPPIRRPKLCYHFQRNSCWYGDNCKYSHETWKDVADELKPWKEANLRRMQRKWLTRGPDLPQDSFGNVLEDDIDRSRSRISSRRISRSSINDDQLEC